MTDKSLDRINRLYTQIEKTQKSASRGRQVIPALNFKKELQKVTLPLQQLTQFLNMLRRTAKSFLSFLVNKTGTHGHIDKTGLNLRGNIPLETLARLKEQFITSVECAICGSIETEEVNGVKSCLACSS